MLVHNKQGLIPTKQTKPRPVASAAPRLIALAYVGGGGMMLISGEEEDDVPDN